MKDGDSEGQTIGSCLELVDVGKDEDGEPITSCVIVEAEAQEHSFKTDRLPANHQTMLTLLSTAGPNGLTVEEWNAKGKEQGIGLKRHATLYDIRQALKDRKLVHEYAERWYVT